ncbi:hypothetical protein A6V39_04060 [Candidatus Mycoplasma haematobovis]|uniref:Uncharacterized protein n=1 Tax=Candidatus Mycoplasma haematobovis TaxID=432608 RepID=A0A1A9QC79_9MOLU|nr:hypothetical protein [Candidatus Mycoplasma haematobovis]OAL10063.1 hypothetical protein A6V39_04060 [Candidatus Mycoplasma haematobovis]
MSKLKFFATLLFSALGIFGANWYYKPRNIKDLLKWQGIKLASDNKAWKSMFFEHQEELKLKGIENEDSLWSWCSERFKSTNLDDDQTLAEAKKYCSDSAQSIMGRIIREGEENMVIGKDDYGAFAVNYVLTGHSKEVLDLVNLPEEQQSNTFYVSQELSKWCEKKKIEKITNQEDLDKFSNFKKRCYNRGVKTISDLLKKQGLKPMTGDEAYKKRFKDELKDAPKLIEEIRSNLEIRRAKLKEAWQFLRRTKEAYKSKEELDEEEAKELERISKIVPDNPEDKELKENGWRHYKWWCEDRLKRNLTDAGIYPNTYAIVSYRCTEKVA